jgi:hypothetical protein
MYFSEEKHINLHFESETAPEKSQRGGQYILHEEKGK